MKRVRRVMVADWGESARKADSGPKGQGWPSGPAPPRPALRGKPDRRSGPGAQRRDWTGFAAAACEVDDRVRHLTVARFEQASEHEARLTFVADGFLTHMVRNLVGTLLDISRGRLEVEQITRVLESNDRRLAGATAPAHGLFLERVGYPDTPSG